MGYLALLALPFAAVYGIGYLVLERAVRLYEGVQDRRALRRQAERDLDRQQARDARRGAGARGAARCGGARGPQGADPRGVPGVR